MEDCLAHFRSSLFHREQLINGLITTTTEGNVAAQRLVDVLSQKPGGVVRNPPYIGDPDEETDTRPVLHKRIQDLQKENDSLIAELHAANKKLMDTKFERDRLVEKLTTGSSVSEPIVAWKTAQNFYNPKAAALPGRQRGHSQPREDSRGWEKERCELLARVQVLTRELDKTGKAEENKRTEYADLVVSLYDREKEEIRKKSETYVAKLAYTSGCIQRFLSAMQKLQVGVMKKERNIDSLKKDFESSKSQLIVLSRELRAFEDKDVPKKKLNISLGKDSPASSRGKETASTGRSRGCRLEEQQTFPGPQRGIVTTTEKEAEFLRQTISRLQMEKSQLEALVESLKRTNIHRPPGRQASDSNVQGYEKTLSDYRRTIAAHEKSEAQLKWALEVATGKRVGSEPQKKYPEPSVGISKVKIMNAVKRAEKHMLARVIQLDSQISSRADRLQELEDVFVAILADRKGNSGDEEQRSKENMALKKAVERLQMELKGKCKELEDRGRDHAANVQRVLTQLNTKDQMIKQGKAKIAELKLQLEQERVIAERSLESSAVMVACTQDVFSYSAKPHIIPTKKFSGRLLEFANEKAGLLSLIEAQSHNIEQTLEAQTYRVQQLSVRTEFLQSTLAGPTRLNQEEKSAISRKCSDLEAALRLAEEEAGSKGSQIESLKTELRKTQGKNAELEVSLTKAVKEWAQRTQDLMRICSEVSGGNFDSENAGHFTEALDGLGERLEKVQGNVQQLRNVVGKRNKENLRLRQQVSKLELENEGLRRDLAGHMSEKQLSSLAEAETQSKMQASLRTAISGVCTRVLTSICKISNTTSTQLDEYDARISTMDKLVRELSGNAVKGKSEILRLAQENSELRSLASCHSETTRTVLALAQKCANTSPSPYEKLTSVVQSCEARIAHAQSQLKTLCDEARAVRAENARMKQLLATQETKHSESICSAKLRISQALSTRIASWDLMVTMASSKLESQSAAVSGLSETVRTAAAIWQQKWADGTERLETAHGETKALREAALGKEATVIAGLQSALQDMGARYAQAVERLEVYSQWGHDAHEKIAKFSTEETGKIGAIRNLAEKRLGEMAGRLGKVVETIHRDKWILMNMMQEFAMKLLSKNENTVSTLNAKVDFMANTLDSVCARLRGALKFNQNVSHEEDLRFLGDRIAALEATLEKQRADSISQLRGLAEKTQELAATSFIKKVSAELFPWGQRLDMISKRLSGLKEHMQNGHKEEEQDRVRALQELQLKASGLENALAEARSRFGDSQSLQAVVQQREAEIAALGEKQRKLANLLKEKEKLAATRDAEIVSLTKTMTEGCKAIARAKHKQRTVVESLGARVLAVRETVEGITQQLALFRAQAFEEIVEKVVARVGKSANESAHRMEGLAKKADEAEKANRKLEEKSRLLNQKLGENAKTMQQMGEKLVHLQEEIENAHERAVKKSGTENDLSTRKFAELEKREAEARAKVQETQQLVQERQRAVQEWSAKCAELEQRNADATRVQIRTMKTVEACKATLVSGMEKLALRVRKACFGFETRLETIQNGAANRDQQIQAAMLSFRDENSKKCADLTEATSERLASMQASLIRTAETATLLASRLKVIMITGPSNVKAGNAEDLIKLKLTEEQSRTRIMLLETANAELRASTESLRAECSKLLAAKKEAERANDDLIKKVLVQQEIIAKADDEEDFKTCPLLPLKDNNEEDAKSPSATPVGAAAGIIGITRGIIKKEASNAGDSTPGAKTVVNLHGRRGSNASANTCPLPPKDGPLRGKNLEELESQIADHVKDLLIQCLEKIPLE